MDLITIILGCLCILLLAVLAFFLAKKSAGSRAIFKAQQEAKEAARAAAIAAKKPAAAAKVAGKKRPADAPAVAPAKKSAAVKKAPAKKPAATQEKKKAAAAKVLYCYVRLECRIRDICRQGVPSIVKVHHFMARLLHHMIQIILGPGPRFVLRKPLNHNQ